MADLKNADLVEMAIRSVEPYIGNPITRQCARMRFAALFAEAERRGAAIMLDQIRASLDYPLEEFGALGGDINIMASVERLIAEAREQENNSKK